MNVRLNRVVIDDQTSAPGFYVGKPGLVKKTEILMAEFGHMTVVVAARPDKTELVLEPNAFSSAATYQNQIYKSQVP